jgi:hypothetical protein
MNPITEKIENDLNKIFESSSEKWVKVSSILYWLDLSEITKSIDQRESVYSVESMLKLYIYKRVKGISNYPRLTEELTKNNNIGQLNLTEVPTKQNFNYFSEPKLISRQ